MEIRFASDCRFIVPSDWLVSAIMVLTARLT
jgi:hypothetical protein